MTPEMLTSIRELDSRLIDGIQVRLLWRKLDGRVWVSVLDTKTRNGFSVEVRARDRPLDIFHHPYAYAGQRGVMAASPSLADDFDQPLAV